MTQPLRIVLPVHNGEYGLERTVKEILQLSSDTSTEIQLIVVDDASTDETFETASELSRQMPQIEVLRQPTRIGLKAILQQVARRFPSSDAAIVHNGSGKLDLEQLAQLFLKNKGETSESTANHPVQGRGSRRFAEVRRLQESMEAAHGSPGMFIWVSLDGQPQESDSMNRAHEPRSASVVQAKWPTASFSAGIGMTT